MQFNQPDTLIPNLYDYQSFKRFSYVNNNQRPTWLDLAHRKLDEAVFAA